MSRSLRELYESSPFSSAQAPYLEKLYERFLADPPSLAPEWRDLFSQFIAGARSTPRPSIARRMTPNSAKTAARTIPTARSDDAGKRSDLSRFFQFHANRGVLIAEIDPPGLMKRPAPHVLELSYVGLTGPNLETEFLTGSRTSAVKSQMKLREIFVQLCRIYAGHTGAEFADVSEADELLWLQDRFQDGRLQRHFAK